LQKAEIEKWWPIIKVANIKGRVTYSHSTLWNFHTCQLLHRAASVAVLPYRASRRCNPIRSAGAHRRWRLGAGSNVGTEAVVA